MKRYRDILISFIAMFLACIILIAIAVYYHRRDNASKKNDEYITINGSLSSENKSYTSYDFAMGTSVSVTFYDAYLGVAGEEVNSYDTLAVDVFKLIRNLDTDVLSWRDESSMVSRLNKDEASIYDEYFVDESEDDETIVDVGNYEDDEKEKLYKQKVRKDAMILMDMISVSTELCQESGGSLDITLRPLIDLWGIEEYSGNGEDFIIPSEDELISASEKTGYDRIEIDAASENTYNPLENIILNGTQIDLGSVGKGYSLDHVYNEFVEKYMTDRDEAEERAYNKRGMVLSVGGSIMAVGSRSDGTGFRIGVRDPNGRVNDTLGYIRIEAGCKKACISTSGNYEKYVIKDGVRYHHIIDPSTLYPADSGLISVTVVCDENSAMPEYAGLLSDGLSTACYILGRENSLELLKKYKAEAVFVDENGELFVTDGLKDSFIRE